MKTPRKKSEVRKEDILAKALKLAETKGYRDVTREEITTAAGVSGPVVNYHFGTMTQFQRDLMRYAVRHENLAVIAQGLCARDPQARKASEELRRRAVDSML